jgi:hypothetical protein
LATTETLESAIAGRRGGQGRARQRVKQFAAAVTDQKSAFESVTCAVTVREVRSALGMISSITASLVV